jgi:antitoxin YefM
MGVNNMHSINFTDARKHFADTMKRVTDDAEPVRILRREAPDVMMVDAEEYEALTDRNGVSL